MRIKILFFCFTFWLASAGYAQCSYTGTPLTQAGPTYTFCIDNSPITTATVNAGQFVTVNVVKGFRYTFAIGNIFSGIDETITVFDATNTVTPLIFATGSSSASINNWMAPISGQIRILLSKAACINDNTTGGTMTLTLNSIGNTQDSQAALGPDNQWTGHVYNAGGAVPGGGSPNPLSTTTAPFINANYAGYYNLGTETINEGFGGDNVCFPVLSNGINRTNIATEGFAVRYRMKSTKTGCFLIRVTADDGVRLYVDNVLVYNEWKDQSPTTYTNLLVNLTGTSELVLDYYENAGGNTITFDIIPFNAASNSITPATAQINCSGVTPNTLIGSLSYNGSQTNPSFDFQWQSSTDGLTFLSIPSATNKDYTPPATTPAVPTTLYYRRVATGKLSPTCTFFSNTVPITTSPTTAVPAAPTATAATNPSCGQITANWTAPVLSNYVIDVSTSPAFTTFFAGYNNFAVGNVNTFAITGLNAGTTYYYRIRAVSGCGTQSVNSNIISDTTGAITGPLTQAGPTYTLCIDNGSIPTTTVNAGQFVLTNVVMGYNYTFSIGDVFSGDLENLTLLDATTNMNISPAAGTAGLNGTALTWTATFSGQVKILLSKGFCSNLSATGGTMTLTLNTIGNTLPADDPSTIGSGINKWIGYVYNSNSGAAPGGSPSAAAVPSNIPFTAANYAGYYNPTSGTPTLNENFGGSNTCFSILSNGINRTNIRTEGFAVRYRMRWTNTAGCYMATFTNADDGVRMYVDNVRVFDEWKDQGNQTYTNVLINLNTNSELVLDYYENGGGNNVSFNIAAFDTNTNTITAPATTAVCSNVAPGTIVGTNYAYNGSTTNPSISYQWQVSPTGLAGSYVNISSATAKDYAPPAITTTTTVVNYYVRLVRSAPSSSCTFASNPVVITTNPGVPATPTAINGKNIICFPTTGLVYSIAPVAGAATYTWTFPLNWTVTAGLGTNSITVSALATAASGTISVTAGNGCGTSAAATMAVTVAATNTYTDSPPTWSAGAPPPTTNGTQNIIINGNLITSVNLSGCSCTINAGKKLTINAGTTLTLLEQLAVNAAAGTEIIFENTASLIQTNDTPSPSNSGTITYKRSTPSLFRYDFTYWSSPVAGQTLGDPLTGLSPNTLSDKYFSWSGTAWANESKTATMALGKGYIIRAPQTNDLYGGTATPFTGIFKGVPNNGVLSSYANSINAGNFYLIGNPYPSAVSAVSFLSANSSVLDGTLYFWTHNTAPNANNYNNGDYAAWNGTGGVAANSGGAVPNGFIAAGQSFFAKAKAGAAAATAVFNNAMRVATTTGATGRNSQFFRTANTKKSVASTSSLTDKGRVWLNLTNTNNAFRQMLLGYVEGATNELDAAFDGETMSATGTNLYSIVGDKNLVIQGRALPFDSSQRIALGYTAPSAGSFSISIDQTDGVFDNQAVYLEDQTNGSIVDLKKAPYVFVTTKGTFNNRFALKFASGLGSNAVELENAGVLVFAKNKELQIRSSLHRIKTVWVYDLAGKGLYAKTDVGTADFAVANPNWSQGVYVVKVLLENGVTQVQKVVLE